MGVGVSEYDPPMPPNLPAEAAGPLRARRGGLRASAPSVDCPACGARAGEPCRTLPRAGVQSVPTHPHRVRRELVKPGPKVIIVDDPVKPLTPEQTARRDEAIRRWASRAKEAAEQEVAAGLAEDVDAREAELRGEAQREVWQDHRQVSRIFARSGTTTVVCSCEERFVGGSEGEAWAKFEEHRKL